MAPPDNRRPGHSRRAQYSLFIAYVLAIAGATLGAVLILLSRFDPPAFAALRSAVTEVIAPASGGADGARRAATSIPEAVGNYVAAGSQNADLRARLKNQERDIQLARSIIIENGRLKRLLALRDGDVATVAVARLVSATGTSTRRYAVMSAGRTAGVRPGQSVRGPDGLVGRVAETGLASSRVLLITDDQSVVPVRRTRDGLPAFAYGHGDGLIEIRGVSTGGANIYKAGDSFVTSGAGGVFPPGIPVARVIQPQGDSALARAFANPDALDFALVQPVFVAAPPPPAPAAP